MNNSIKNNLRKQMKIMRNNLNNEYIIDSAKKICNTIQNLPQYQQAQNIALYYAIPGEISLYSIWHAALRIKKSCYFPVLTNDKNLLFLQANLTTIMHTNCYNIMEPDKSSNSIELQNLDIIFLPLLAFDTHGTRLGMGSGYYDQTLSKNHKALLIGVAYDFQLQPDIIPNTWDIPLNIIITPNNIYWITS